MNTKRHRHPPSSGHTRSPGFASSPVPRLTSVLLTLVWLSLSPAISAADLFLETSPPGWSKWIRHSWAPAWGDVDRDGLLDAFVPRTASDDGSGATTNLLYRNLGNGGFRPMLAEEVGTVVTDKDPSVAGFWADANNDGLPDLLVMNLVASVSSPPIASRLYLNRGGGRFDSVDAGALTQPQRAYGFASWVDYDRDGLLDVFLGAARADGVHRTNLLFHGVGDGRFELVTEGRIATDQLTSGFTNEGVWSDLDGDGDPDLLVANWPSGTGSFIYCNEGSGRFTRMTECRLESPSNSSALYAFGDVDNDGDMDVVASGDAVRVFFNDGSWNFRPAQTLPALGAAACADYDNDGWLDLALFRENTTSEPIDLYHNDGDGTFTSVEDAITRPRDSGILAPWIDVDNDGFLDLVVGRQSGDNAFYRNQGNGNHWLKLTLQGTASNRSAIGAKVRVRASLQGKVVWQMREIISSMMSEDGLRANFGLGDAAVADQVRIEWPSGTVQELSAVEANRMLTVTEPTPIRLRCVLQPPDVRLEIQAAPNTSCEIQASADLRVWNAFLTLPTDGSGAAATAITPGSDSFRFYRAVQR